MTVSTSANLKKLALYLPQFHRIPENDEWWGEGFTEWTNVRRGKALFPGHTQPRMPTELGWYDLSDATVMERQTELAQAHGIDGFVFYHYWFSGRRILEMPVDRLLASGRPEKLNYCLCWANHTWGRNWDGREGEKKILLKQEHDAADDMAFIRSMFPHFEDKRYVRLNGKPVLLILWTHLFPDMKATTERWREECYRAGIGDIYLVRCESHGVQPTPECEGFDAAYDFPHHQHFDNSTRLWTVEADAMRTTPGFTGKVYSYPHVVARHLSRMHAPYRRFHTACLDWDNTARKMLSAQILHDFTLPVYQHWVAELALDSLLQAQGQDHLLLFNAWNEWAEGTYLEPDELYGMGRLQATAAGLSVAEDLYAGMMSGMSADQVTGYLQHLLMRDQLTQQWTQALHRMEMPKALEQAARATVAAQSALGWLRRQAGRVPGGLLSRLQSR